MVSFVPFARVSLLCAAALAGSAAQAQTPSTPSLPVAAAASRAADPVIDPAAPVPVDPYRSVFGKAPTGVETQALDWRRANADVGQFRRGHADILKWEAQHGEAHR